MKAYKERPGLLHVVNPNLPSNLEVCLPTRSTLQGPYWTKANLFPISSQRGGRQGCCGIEGDQGRVLMKGDAPFTKQRPLGKGILAKMGGSLLRYLPLYWTLLGLVKA